MRVAESSPGMVSEACILELLEDMGMTTPVLVLVTMVITLEGQCIGTVSVTM